ncbi:MAG TPA: Gfo/Idh/MocA family oxidoreductase [Firmicutes bacterium]|jgi:UDP-N-acetylglucosamine 3-dehydrogenase|nr:MAG: hypothetical protein AA931_03730 [Peptococcaceae bacterium 1109]HHT74333.1 Gfo/Idh/MocA family oxidoreductase [Bacillota bacterium]
MIRVGVIGYGTMGQLHSANLKKLPGVELAAVADLDAERRRQAEAALGVKTYEQGEELISDPHIDLVAIAVPTDGHGALLKRAVELDKHVFCEKPLVRTKAECRMVEKLAAKSTKKIGVGHVVRFSPEYAAAREKVLAGSIGRPAVARTFRGGSMFPLGWQDWYADFDRSGGVILDLAIHDIDYLRWCFGEVTRVYAKSTKGLTDERMEHAFVILRFENGVIAHVEGNWANYQGQFYTTLEMAGSKGIVSFDTRHTAPILYTKAGAQGEQANVTLPESPALVSPYEAEIADMIAAIQEGRDPKVTLKDALATTRVALAALESLETGQAVNL